MAPPPPQNTATFAINTSLTSQRNVWGHHFLVETLSFPCNCLSSVQNKTLFCLLAYYFTNIVECLYNCLFTHFIVFQISSLKKCVVITSVLNHQRWSHFLEFSDSFKYSSAIYFDFLFLAHLGSFRQAEPFHACGCSSRQLFFA